MQNIGDVYDFINFIANKYLKGFLSPPEVSKALANGNDMWFNRKLSDRQQGNELGLLALAPFKKQSTITASSSGILTKPGDYAEAEGLFVDINGVLTSIRQVFRNELADAVNSVIYPIAANPVFLENASSFTIYPNQAFSVGLDYISIPTDPAIGFTVGVNGVTYNPATSVQLQAAKQYWPEIVLYSLPYIGVNLSEQEITNLIQLNQNAATN